MFSLFVIMKGKLNYNSLQSFLLLLCWDDSNRYFLWWCLSIWAPGICKRSIYFHWSLCSRMSLLRFNPNRDLLNYFLTLKFPISPAFPYSIISKWNNFCFSSIIGFRQHLTKFRFSNSCRSTTHEIRNRTCFISSLIGGWLQNYDFLTWSISDIATRKIQIEMLSC